MKHIFTKTLLLIALWAMIACPLSLNAAVSKPAKIFEDKLIVYYLHTTGRCYTCLMMERYTDEALRMYFSNEINSGRIQWKVLDVQLPENKHFIKDYSLYTKSVVVSQIRAGKELRWKNLDQIWMKVRDKNAYLTYIKQEIDTFLKDHKP
jgi:hypothetical protein